jgi:hypothetical protein
MNENEWIVCERTSRWAAAIRVAAARQPSTAVSARRIYEVRTLDDLAEHLRVRPASLALVEVHTGNLGSVMLWVATCTQRFPRACFVGLFDGMTHLRSNSRSVSASDAKDAIDALIEAGAAEIATSPRHLQHIFSLAAKHDAAVANSQQRSEEPPSIANWAWSLLPWKRSS